MHESPGLGDNDEQLFEQKEVAGLSQGQIVRRRFFRHRVAMVSLLVLLVILVLSATSIGWGPIPGWWTWDWNERVPQLQDQSPTLSIRPTWLGGGGVHLGDHPFGVDDERGRDMFAQVMRGVQSSFIVIFVVGVLSTTIGVVVGAVAGFFGGLVDAFLMRITDVVIVVPLLLLAGTAGFSFGWDGVWSVALLLGLFSWTGLARLVRAEFLALREREFVDAARVASASSRRIIFKHILPNTLGVVIVNSTLVMGVSILAETALSFLNFGVKPPEVSLGSLASLYQSSFDARPFLFLWPGILIVTIVLCIQFVGDGLRDAFDPRQKRVPKRRDLEGPRSDPGSGPLRDEAALAAAASQGRHMHAGVGGSPVAPRSPSDGRD